MIIKVINPTSIKQFVADYRLPLGATVIYVVLVIFMVMGRLQERSVLGQILAVNNSAGQGYANLLSKDKSDPFTRNNVTDTGTNQTGQTHPTTGGTATNGSTPAGTSGSGGGTGNNTGGGPTPPAPVFSASITEFRQDQPPVLQCSSGGPNGPPGNLLKCNKVYSFMASVQTVNGPGAVSYNWRYSVAGSNSGSFNAASGTNTTTLRNEITLNCRDAGDFTAQIALTSPGSSQSQVLQISHDCTA